MDLNLDLRYQAERIIPAATVIFVAVIFSLIVISAISSGKKAAQSKAVLQNTRNVAAALGFFYSDQQRYPSALEFSNNEIMKIYVSDFPPQNFVSEACQQSLNYQRPDPQNYELFFCLPKASQGFEAGWNRLVN